MEGPTDIYETWMQTITIYMNKQIIISIIISSTSEEFQISFLQDTHAYEKKSNFNTTQLQYIIILFNANAPIRFN